MIGRNSADLITVKDVPAEKFISAYAEHLKTAQKVKPIKGVEYIKTGNFKYLNPYNEDWFYFRCAAIARIVYLRPEIGIGTLRHVFGGSKCHGRAQHHHALASGKVLRFALQQLEAADVLMRLSDKRNKSHESVPDKKDKLLPRIVTPEGHKDLNEIAKSVFLKLYGSN